MALKPQTVETLEELQRLVPSLVQRANRDPALAMRAASNPILALEELGIRLTDPLRLAVERMARIAPERHARAKELAEVLFAHAGGPFDLHDEREVKRIEDQLAKDKSKRSAAKEAPSQGFKEALAEYQLIAKGAKRLTPREDYEKLKRRIPASPIGSVRFVLKRAGAKGRQVKG